MKKTKYYFQKGITIKEIDFTSYDELKQNYLKSFGQAFTTRIENCVIIHQNENISRVYTNEVSQKESAGIELFEALKDITELFKRVTPLYSGDQKRIDKAERAINKALGY